MKYICSIKKSPYDGRDYIYKNINGSIPKILDYRNELFSVRNQGNQGSCYAHSVACMKEWQERKDNDIKFRFSPQFFYDNRFNKYDDNTENDDGMYSRDVMKLLKTVGICREEIYPYGKAKTKDLIDESCYKEAKQYIIDSYYRVFSISSLKDALINYGPILITFPVFNYSSEFWNKNEGEKNIGGHAVLVVGYNKDGFFIRNSWGRDWGDKGYSLYKYNDWGKHWEIWCTIDKKLENEIIKKKDIKCNCLII